MTSRSPVGGTSVFGAGYPVPTSRIPPRPSPWRHARRAAALLLAVGIAYLVSINIFLRTRLFRNLFNFDPEAMLLDYSGAYSVLPGHIHVEGLTLRGSDRQIQWILGLDRCDFTIQWRDLFRRQFHATRVHGDGLTFYVRLRVNEEPVRHIAALPHIPGFTDPPLSIIGPPTAPLTDATYRLWGVQLDNVDAEHVRDLWIDTLRYEGDIHVRGDWGFWPTRFLAVGPASVDTERMNVSYGASRLASDLALSAQATVGPLDLRIPSGLELLKYVSATVAANGRMETPELLSLLLPQALVVEHGEGPVSVALNVRHGEVAAGSTLSFATPAARLRGADTCASASVEADATVEAPHGRATLLAKVRFTDAMLSYGSGKGELREGALSIRSEALDLAASPLSDATFAGTVRGLLTPSITPWAAALTPSPTMAIASGEVRVDADAEGSFAESSVRGQARFSVARLSVRSGENHVSADVDGTLVLGEAQRGDREVNLTGSGVRVLRGTGSVRGVPIRLASAKLQARSAVVRLDGHHTVELSADFTGAELPKLGALSFGPDVSVSGAVAASGSATILLPEERVTAAAFITGHALSWRRGNVDLTATLGAHVSLLARMGTELQLDLFGADVALHGVTGTVENGSGRKVLVTAPVARGAAHRLTYQHGNSSGTVTFDVPSASLPDLSLMGAVVAMPSYVGLEGGKAEASVHAELDSGSLVASGAAAIVSRDARLRFDKEVSVGSLTVQLHSAASSSASDVSGSFASFNGLPLPNTKPWWGRLDLTEAKVDALGAVRFDAKLHLTAENASPLEAVIAASTPVPRWILNVLPMAGLTADGAIRIAPSLVQVRDVVARGTKETVRFEYLHEGAVTEWAVLAEQGLMSVGVVGGSRPVGVVLLGAETWFAHTTNALRSRGTSISAR